MQSSWLRALAVVEQRNLHRAHGTRDAGTWVAQIAGDRPGVARREVELAGQLTAAPLVADAMATGDVSQAKAAELVRARELPAAPSIVSSTTPGPKLLARWQQR